MKSKFLLLPRTLATFGLALILSSLTTLNTRAVDGTWTNLAGGSWATAANWSGGIIANASGGTANFSTLNLGADATVTLDGARTIGSMIFGDTTPSHNWSLTAGTGGALTLAGGTPTITVNNKTNTISLVLAGTVGMTKAGGGTLILAGANTYSGGTTITGGTLQVGNGTAGNLLAGAPITNNSQLTFVGAGITTTMPITGNGTLTLSGTAVPQSGNFVMGTNNAFNGAFTGPIFLNQARIYDNAVLGALWQGRFGNNSTITVPVGSAILAGNANNYTNPVFIAGTGWQETTAPNFLGALRLSAGANWVGPITLTGNARINVHGQPGAVNGPISGPYELELASTLSVSTLTMGSPTNTTAATRIFNFGTTLNVVVTNANALSTGPLTMLGGTLKLSGLSLSFSNLSSASASSQIQNGDPNTPSTLTIGADNSSTTFAGFLADGGAPTLSLTKIGTGALTLSGSSSYNGNTVVSNGMLLLQGASAALSGAGTITVNSGATFGGSGTATGPITVLAGGALQASGSGSASLTCSSPLTTGSSALDLTATRINVGLGGKIVASGGLTVNGTNFISITGGAPVAGVYDLITYTGAIGGSGFAGFVLGTTPPGMVATLQDSGTAVQLNITVSGTEPKIWKGNLASIWSPAAGAEWQGTVSGLPQPYVEFDKVTFDDAATNFTVNLTANVTPSTLVVNNSISNYTFTGIGSIGGDVTLVKNGTGTLTINNTNAFTTPVAINDGTVAVALVANSGVNSPLGAGSSVDFNGGTLQVNELSGSMNRNLNLNGNGTIKTDNALKLSGTISGGGMLTKSGAGTVTLLTTTIHSGGTLINAGTLNVGDGSFFVGGITGNIENHGTLNYFRPESTAEVAIASGISGDGALNFRGTGISLQGRYTLSGDNSAFTGPLTVNNARITTTTQARLSSSTMVTLTNGGTALLNTVEYVNPFTISGIGWLEGAPANYGAIRMANAILSGPIVLAGNARITALNSVGYLIGPISESGGSWKLELGQKEANNSGGIVVIANTNTYTGGTDIRGAVVVVYTNGNLGTGPITLDEGFAATHIPRLDLFGGVTLTNTITLDSTGQTTTRGAIFATNGLATVSGNITITANVGNGGHFGADDATSSTLRISGPILSPTGISPVVFVGTVEVGGGGTYTNLNHGGGILRLAANNGVNPAARLTLGTTTTSSFDLNGFNQTVTGLLKSTGASTTTNSSGTVSTLTLNFSGTNTYAGDVRGNVQLTLASGVCILTGGNDYTGATAVNGGTLLVNGNNSGAGSITVASGAKLGGTGTIQGPITVQSGGTLAPGASIGTLTANGTVTLSAGSTTVMEIGRTGGVTTSDLLTGVSTLNYGGALIVTNIGVNALRSGDSFNLFDAATFNPGFSSVALPPLLPGLSWNTNLIVDGTINITGTVIPPQFNSSSLSGNSLTFAGTGGLAGGKYVVLASTNVAASVTNWTPIATNSFDGSGNFSFGDTVNAAVPQRFYLIAIP